MPAIARLWETPMNWMDFAIRMFAALFLGAAIGLERQWRQRMTGLRTNGLVAVGAAMFIMMGGLISGDGSQGRVAAYVVSGIGFLGGGVILKDGFNIRGMNTAAILSLAFGGTGFASRRGQPGLRHSSGNGGFGLGLATPECPHIDPRFLNRKALLLLRKRR